MLHKVMLINPINYGRRSFRPPFGLLTIASVFAERGIDVRWIDADTLRNDKALVEKQILENLDVDLIATGGLHSAYLSVKEIFQFFADKNIAIPKLIGGKLAQTLDHLIWRRIAGVDILCKQEGEYVVKSLCDHFPNFERILGVEYFKNGKVVKNEPAPIVKSLDEVPPLKWQLLDRDRYFSQGTGYILSSRGCPYACKFCKYPDQLSKNYRVLSTERILDDVKYLISQYNIRTLVFVDEFFLLRKRRAEEFCDAVESQGLKIQWVVSSRADSITAKHLPLLKRMKRLGCRGINMGIESGSQTILDLMRKKLKIEQIETAIRGIHDAGLRLRPTFIFGFPGENSETAMESVRWRLKMESCGLYHANKKGKHFYATPYPGAPLYDEFLKKYDMNLQEEEKWILQCASLKKPTVNLTDMKWDELTQLDKECQRILKDYRRPIRTIKHAVSKYLPTKILDLFEG